MRWVLFDTKIGELLLTLLERHVGLAVVQANWLAEQRCGEQAGQPTLIVPQASRSRDVQERTG